MQHFVLERLCSKINDVIYGTFTRKYYLVKISQLKKGHIYLIVRKKRGRLIGEEKKTLHNGVFKRYCEKK